MTHLKHIGTRRAAQPNGANRSREPSRPDSQEQATLLLSQFSDVLLYAVSLKAPAIPESFAYEQEVLSLPILSYMDLGSAEFAVHGIRVMPLLAHPGQNLPIEGEDFNPLSVA